MQRRLMVFAAIAGMAVLVLGCSPSTAGGQPKAQDQKSPAPQATSSAPTPQAAASTPTSTGGQTKVAKQYTAPPSMTIDPKKSYDALIETNQGEITVHLLPDAAPTTVNSFVFLAREGFYEGVKFHRVVKGFVIQAGDPTGTGAGGPGYKFQDELPKELDYDRGVLAMANAGPNTNGSQFFITLDSLKGRLPKNYTIFGKVTAGMETVDKIGAAPVARGGGGEVSSPTAEQVINKITITEK